MNTQSGNELSVTLPSAGTNGDVLNVHTERRQRYGHRQFCLPKFVHVGLSRAPEVQQRTPCMLPIFSLRTGREQHVAESSIYSPHLNTLFNSRRVTHHTYRPSSLTSQPLWLKLTSFTTFSIVNTNSFAVFGSAFAPSTSFTVLSWFVRDQQSRAKCAFISHT